MAKHSVPPPHATFVARHVSKLPWSTQRDDPKALGKCRNWKIRAGGFEPLFLQQKMQVKMVIHLPAAWGGKHSKKNNLTFHHLNNNLRNTGIPFKGLCLFSCLAHKNPSLEMVQQKPITKENTHLQHQWCLTSWWFQPLWKICNRQIGSFPPGRDENQKYLSCHQPVKNPTTTEVTCWFQQFHPKK